MVSILRTRPFIRGATLNVKGLGHLVKKFLRRSWGSLATKRYGGRGPLRYSGSSSGQQLLTYVLAHFKLGPESSVYDGEVRMLGGGVSTSTHSSCEVT